MGERGDRINEPEVYENISANTRFKKLVEFVINKSYKQPEAKGESRVATWSDGSPNGLYQVEKLIGTDPFTYENITLYTLGHIENPAVDDKPPIRYAVSEDSNGHLSMLKILNQQFHEKMLYRKTELDAARRALVILHYTDPQLSEVLLIEAMDERFQSIVGDYVLSDLALNGCEETIDGPAAWTACSEFAEYITVIEKEEVQRAEDKHPQSPYMETVKNAAETKPTDMPGYMNVEFLTHAELSARAIRKLWKNAIDPNKQPSERFRRTAP